jgi:formylmethanofuran dehydrogenase subunit E
VCKQELKKAIENAERLHGHLGPFLVVGVRMGNLATKTLCTSKDSISQIIAKTPPATPFSCVLDGIQATTSCTIGNRKLHIKNSKQEIKATFQQKKSKRTMEVTVNSKVVKELTNRISKGASNDTLAKEMATMPERQLFEIK